MSKLELRLAGVVAVLALVGASCGSSGSSSSASGKTLDLGAVLSLTGGGGVYGPQQKQAVELAQQTINDGGGVNGAKVRVTVVDDASDKSQAAQQTQTLINQQRVTALLGPTLSNSAVAAHPIAANAKTPMLAVSTTGFNIVGPGCTYCNGWIFRDSLGEADAIPTDIKAYVDAHHPKTGALLYPNDDKFSADGAQVVKSTVGKYGIQLVQSIEFTKAETDLTPYITKAVQAKPDVIFVTSLGGIPAKIMSGARQLGFAGDFLGGNGFNSAAVSKQAAAAGKGAQSASAWFLGNDFPSNGDFVKAFKAKFGTDPDQFAAQAYTGMLILADAAKRAKLSYTNIPADRQKLRTALESTDMQTPLGPFRFTKDHDVLQTIWVIAMDGTGGFTLVTSVKPS